MARKQTERMNLRMTPEQKSMIFERVIQAGCPSINRFVVKMCSEGKIVSNDDSYVNGDIVFERE